MAHYLMVHRLVEIRNSLISKKEKEGKISNTLLCQNQAFIDHCKANNLPSSSSAPAPFDSLSIEKG